jgi:hypothetical protein
LNAREECVDYLLQEKKEDRACPLLFARLLRTITVTTSLGEMAIRDAMFTVPANKTSLYVWSWNYAWKNEPISVVQAALLDKSASLVVELLKNRTEDFSQQKEMKGMFGQAVDQLMKAHLYRPHLINEMDCNHELILFEHGMALHRDSKELFHSQPRHMLSLSTGYSFPASEIAELKQKLADKSVDLRDLLLRMKAREMMPDWSMSPVTPGIASDFKVVCSVIQALSDIHDLYEPDVLLTMHVIKFLASLFFSRGNEEHAIPLGEGENGKSWLMFVVEALLGDYACGIQAGVYGQPVPSPKAPNPDWLALKGRKAFLGGEKGSELKLDAGTYKALRDPTNVIELRGLCEGNVKFRSAGNSFLLRIYS